MQVMLRTYFWMRRMNSDRGKLDSWAFGKSQDQEVDIIYVLLCIAIILQGVAAYSVLGFPIPWVGRAIGALILLLELSRVKIRWPPGMLLLLLYLCYSFSITVLTWHSQPIVRGLTEPYPIFIGLRYFDVVCFIGIFICSNRYGYFYGKDRMIIFFINLSMFFSLYAIYTYLAHYLHLPVLPRTRMSTGGGGNMDLEYTYAFYRATGSFQEPSHLAQWLTPAILATMLHPKYKNGKKLVVMVSAFILTGSLLGAVAVVTGILIYMFTAGLKRRLQILTIVPLIALVMLILNYVKIDFLDVITNRVSNILSGGMLESSRGSIYQFMYTHVPPLFGYGLGNSNLYFSDQTNSPLVRTYANLFFDTWMSLGVIGLFIVALFFIVQLKRLLRKNNRQERSLSLSIYGAWIALYFGHISHLDMVFAFWAGVLVIGDENPVNRNYVAVSDEQK